VTPRWLWLVAGGVALALLWAGYEQAAYVLGAGLSLAGLRKAVTPPQPQPPGPGAAARQMADSERAEVDADELRAVEADASIRSAAEDAEPPAPGAPVRSRFLDRLRRRGGALCVVALLQPCPDTSDLREQHAAMDAAGMACLDALDDVRGDLSACRVLSVGRLDAVAVALDAQSAALRLAEAQPQLRAWAFAAVGGGLAAGVAIGADAAGLTTTQAAAATLGAAALGAAIAGFIQWAGEP